MAILFMDGFDKYGGVNSNQTSVQALLQQEWTTVSGGDTIVTGLSATGFALNANGNAAGATKTLAGNYSRLIGGVRFSSTLGAVAGINFLDSGSIQASIAINTTGTISVRNAAFSTGTVLGTSTATVAANSTHYLEWDITFSNTGSYQLWLDGTSILSGSGDTTATANNFANGVQFSCVSAGNVIWDDFYLFDTTGTTNNAVLLTSPRIETTFPTADSAVQFSVGASTLGNSVSRSSTNYSTSVNQLYVRPYTPTRNCTLNSISLLPLQTNASSNLRPVVYADNAGTPNGGALLSAGSTVTGQTAGILLTMPLTTPQSLTAGTQYWLGFMVDVASTNMTGQDASAVGRNATATFTSGAPGTCPTTTGGQVSAVVYGNITLSSSANFYEVASIPPQGLQSYVVDSTATHEDLYSFGSLSTTPTNIYAVAVKANVARSDTGAKTVSMRTKSSTTDSGGNLTGQTAAPATFGWLGSYFETDPNGSIAWTAANLNAATSGVRIDS